MVVEVGPDRKVTKVMPVLLDRKEKQERKDLLMDQQVQKVIQETKERKELLTVLQVRKVILALLVKQVQKAIQGQKVTREIKGTRETQVTKEM